MYEYNAELDLVVDGDTLDVIIDLGFKLTTNQRIRLANIDTPEIFRTKQDSEEYRKGIEAKKYVEKRLKENQGKMKINTYKNTGKYGRYIGQLRLKDSQVSLNEELVEKGYAKRVK